jgi:hypothetical protein
MGWVVIFLGGFLYWIWARLKTRTRRITPFMALRMAGSYHIEANGERQLSFRIGNTYYSILKCRTIIRYGFGYIDKKLLQI